LETILSINNLSKQYRRIRAVDKLSFDVERGSVFGILGPNGSGKTTTLGIVLDVINQSTGSYTWFGKASSKESRKRIGAILENPLFYPYLSATRNLKIIADIKGVAYSHIDEVLKVVDLFDRRNDKFKTYSLGMKQRLAIASAILGEPEVIVLDEPTNGLDPQGIAEVRELIVRVASRGTTIILASHLLDEVQKVCTHVVVLKSGKSLFSGKVDDVLVDAESIELGADDIDKLYEVIKTHPKVGSVEKKDGKLIVVLSEDVSSTEINDYLINKGIVLSHLAVREKSLEEQFFKLLAK